MKTIIRGVFVVAAAITSACFWPVLAQAADAPGADAAATDTLAEVIVIQPKDSGIGSRAKLVCSMAPREIVVDKETEARLP